jgi:phage minor structural protein
MIPILYAANETVFTHNGLGLLTDAIQCEVTEERNGIYEAVIQYPITGIHYADIVEDCIVKALPNEISEPQLFRIYKISKPIDGVETISLEHISYTLNGNPVASYSVINSTGTQAVQAALNGATFAHGFTCWSDITSQHSTAFTSPLSVRNILGGTEGSVIDTWGGEYEFDNFVVKLHAARGTATDIVIEYGKNLTDLKQERNISNVYTALFPYAKYVTKSTLSGVEIETEHTVTLTEKTIAAPTAANYAHSKALIHDFSSSFARDAVINETDLRAAANAYMSANPIDTPSVNITVSFVQLWQTAEYANIAPLERVKMCDTVTVRFAKLGVSATAKVIKTVYDTLLERYVSIELGTAKSNLATAINNQQTQINTLNTEIKTQTGILHQAILNATALITGQAGGYVVLNPPENPQEILIMNTASIVTATKVWRWNSAGLGYSHEGYYGPYETAITMDGGIVADFITTGTLNASLIKAGLLQSYNGKTWINLVTGQFSLGDGALTWEASTGFDSLSAKKIKSTPTSNAYGEMGAVGIYTGLRLVNGTTEFFGVYQLAGLGFSMRGPTTKNVMYADTTQTILAWESQNFPGRISGVYCRGYGFDFNINGEIVLTIDATFNDNYKNTGVTAVHNVDSPDGAKALTFTNGLLTGVNYI